MMKNNFLIEVIDDSTAIITSVDKDGVKKAKRIHLKTLSDVLNLKSSNFNTGILPSNIVNIYQNGTYRAYHIFVPSYSTKISHLRYSEEPVFVKYPSMLFSFINDMSASKSTTKRSMIRVLDTEIFNTNHLCIRFILITIQIVMEFVGAIIKTLLRKLWLLMMILESLHYQNCS